jgi:hypothetical protein
MQNVMNASRQLHILKQNILDFAELITSLFPHFLGCKQYIHYWEMKALH